MIAQILGALSLIKEILDLAKGLKEFIDKSKEEAWFKDSHEAFKNFQQKTPEERMALARAVADLLKRMQ